MPSKRNVSYHAYNAASPMNNRKLAEFDCLLPVWRRGLVFAMGGWTRVLTSGGELPVGWILRVSPAGCPSASGIP